MDQVLQEFKNRIKIIYDTHDREIFYELSHSSKSSFIFNYRDLAQYYEEHLITFNIEQGMLPTLINKNYVNYDIKDSDKQDMQKYVDTHINRNKKK